MSSKPREGFDCDYELSIKDNQDINLNQDYIELDPATMARRRNDGSYDNPLPMSIGITPKQAAHATLNQDKRVENSTGFREKHPQSPDRPLSLKTINCVIVVYGILLLISIALGAIGAFKEENKDTTFLAESHAALLKSLDIINGICNERDANGTTRNLALGTAGNPALSCEQIKGARDVQSGWYYVRGESNTFHKVYCDMDTFGGGWTRFGKYNMNILWNFVDENTQTSTIDIISDSDLLKMRRLRFTEFIVLTDVKFRLQADDSINPSFISAVLVPDLTPHQVRIIGSADHTHILFDDDDDQLECFSGGVTNKCGTGNLPPVGTKSHKLFFQSAFFGPRASGASIMSGHENQWQRNMYTWSGDYYFVLAK